MSHIAQWLLLTKLLTRSWNLDTRRATEVARSGMHQPFHRLVLSLSSIKGQEYFQTINSQAAAHAHLTHFKELLWQLNWFSFVVSCTRWHRTSQRNLHPNSKDTDKELLERVKANMRTPRTWALVMGRGDPFEGTEFWSRCEANEWNHACLLLPNYLRIRFSQAYDPEEICEAGSHGLYLDGWVCGTISTTEALPQYSPFSWVRLQDHWIPFASIFSILLNGKPWSLVPLLRNRRF